MTNRSIPLATDYAPYHELPEFIEGFEAYGKTWFCPYVDPKDGVKAQAWDRGLEFAARSSRNR